MAKPAGHDLKLVKNALIPMRDGVRLAADLLMPAIAGRFPCVFEYYPYHKDGGTGLLTGMAYRANLFASHGYCYGIVDVRGTGASEGVCTDIYSLQEQDDGYEIVEWLANQDWSTGMVGMLGSSYGFSSTVMVAAKNPPHLKAIAPYMGDVDLYECMWEGGGFLGWIYGGYYGPHMYIMNTLPPHYRDPEGRWIGMWNERVEKNLPWAFDFIGHQVDGEYWREKSIATDYNRIKVPTMTLVGWLDQTCSYIPELFTNIDVPKKMIIGPWPHDYPNEASVAPRVDVYLTMLRWFDHWLKGDRNGVMDEPPILLYTTEYTHPDVLRSQTGSKSNGSWRYEGEWPPKSAAATPLYLLDGSRLGSEPGRGDGSATFEYDPTVGTFAGLWGGHYGPMAFPLDQRGDEAKSLSFATEPLDRDTEITGTPSAELYFSSTAAVAGVSVKLCDVAPDGSTILVLRTYKNATQRDSRTDPAPLHKGKVYKLDFGLDSISHRFLKGHRVKALISGADFPYIWPTPTPCRSTVHLGSGHPSRLILPIVAGGRRRGRLNFPTPAPVEYPESRSIVPPYWRVRSDMSEESVAVDWGFESESRFQPATTVRDKRSMTQKTHRHQPGDTRLETVQEVTVTQPGSTIHSRNGHVIQSDERFFHISCMLEITQDGLPFARKNWSRTFPRLLC